MLTLELLVELPVELAVVLDPELGVAPAAPLVVVAEVEAMVVLLPCAPGDAASEPTMVTAWAPLFVPNCE